MRDNPVQFAVVREDPLVELEVLQRWPCRRLLLVASGGCTALTLASRRPSLQITAIDPNPAQLELARAKQQALASLEGPALRARFDVGEQPTSGLSECGNFESLFRGLRGFLHEHVASASQLAEVLRGERAVDWLTGHRYWPVAFQLAFSEAYLVCMFGPDAVQHAPPGSYPDWFQGCFERGLARADRALNPFLHHLLLGHYLPEALPELLRQPPAGQVHWTPGSLEQADFGAFDFIDLSNVLDWMPPERVDALFARLLDETRPGTVVLWRQLNNDRPLARHLLGSFEQDVPWQRSLHEGDRSLFYSSVHVVRRREDPSTR